MPVQTRKLYQSSNGDRWSLGYDPDTPRVFILHEANLSSGGHASEIPLQDFLSQSGLGPEKQELLRLIGGLTET
jgi:hypothetical protein